MGSSASDGVPAPRSLLQSTLLGVIVAVTVAATAFFLIAIPLYTVASFESNGLQRPVIRTGLFRVALPVGVLIGLLTGLVTGRWWRRGGRWVVTDGDDRYTTR